MNFAPALISRLASLLAEITGAPASELREESNRHNTRGWDSVASLSFITAVEEEFNVIIPTAEVMRLNSIGDMARFLNGKGISAPPPSAPPWSGA